MDLYPAYRIVRGVAVLLPDGREAGKRYKNTLLDGERAYIEFTPEEETARDAEEVRAVEEKVAAQEKQAVIEARETRIRELAALESMAREEQDEFVKLLAQRERDSVAASVRAGGVR